LKQKLFEANKKPAATQPADEMHPVMSMRLLHVAVHILLRHQRLASARCATMHQRQRHPAYESNCLAANSAACCVALLTCHAALLCCQQLSHNERMTLCQGFVH
jgi:hypothetical protein